MAPRIDFCLVLRPLTIVAIALCSPLALANDEPPPLPEATALLQGFIESVGGTSAIHGIEAMDATGTIRLPGGRDPGRFRWVVADEGRATFETAFPGLGRSVFGSDGTVGWSALELPSGRTVTRETLETIDNRRRRANWFELAFTLGADATSMRTVGLAEFDGVRAWEIELVRGDERTERVFLEQETKRLLGFTTTLHASPDAPAITVRFGNWRVVDDLTLFHSIAISGGRTRVQLDITSVSFDPPDPATFAPPLDLPDVD